jgi:hypothetical protein
MKYEKTRMIDYKFAELCDEVDRWKDKAEYWKAKYDEEIQASIKQSNESMEIAKKGVANALMFALSVKDDKNGNMVIEKENRKTLAENWK